VDDRWTPCICLSCDSTEPLFYLQNSTDKISGSDIRSATLTVDFGPEVSAPSLLATVTLLVVVRVIVIDGGSKGGAEFYDSQDVKRWSKKWSGLAKTRYGSCS
jgi:hypothetical protein